MFGVLRVDGDIVSSLVYEFDLLVVLQVCCGGLRNYVLFFSLLIVCYFVRFGVLMFRYRVYLVLGGYTNLDFGIQLMFWDCLVLCLFALIFELFLV